MIVWKLSLKRRNLVSRVVAEDAALWRRASWASSTAVHSSARSRSSRSVSGVAESMTAAAPCRNSMRRWRDRWPGVGGRTGARRRGRRPGPSGGTGPSARPSTPPGTWHPRVARPSRRPNSAVSSAKRPARAAMLRADSAASSMSALVESAATSPEPMDCAGAMPEASGVVEVVVVSVAGIGGRTVAGARRVMSGFLGPKASGAEHVPQLDGHGRVQLGVRARVRVPVRTPAHERGGVPEAILLKVVVGNLTHRLGAEGLPGHVLAGVPSVHGARGAALRTAPRPSRPRGGL